jgi:Putative peptidoglycan binding domain
MKSLFVFTCCLALSIANLAAEREGEGKEGKKKQGQSAHAGQGQQTHTQTGRGGKHGRVNQQNLGGAGQANVQHPGKGTQHGQRRFSTGQGTNTAAEFHGKGTGKAQIRHFDNIAKSPNPKIETVKFRENNRIEGAERWKGQKYVVFRNYRAVWHDRDWWVVHYPRIVLIGGGWYFWNAGFWYPAWGYDPTQVYYPYDGPIYAYNDLPPDQVVANVQTALQDQGYYHGEVDGLLGPLTRAALADYQSDHGLYPTRAIDEPTMASLGFA